jgi:predicted dienelactone hydrolase
MRKLRSVWLALYSLLLLNTGMAFSLGLPADREPGDRNVGYRVIDIECQSGGVQKPLTIAIWYPTQATPSHHVYGGSTAGLVAVDAPPDTTGAPYPLLVFSHGYLGTGLAAVFLTEALAAKGWIVAAPDHNDQDSAVRIRGGAQKFNRREAWQHAETIASSGPEQRGKYLYRLDEMAAALQAALADPVVGPLVDRRRIAVGGHSFGGYTALGLCGTIPERRDERIKGVVLFSTGAGGYLFTEEELARVKVPAICFMGEKEKDQKRGTQTMEALTRKIYRQLSTPKFLAVVKGATHFSFNHRFTNTWGARRLSGTPDQFEVIRRYSMAFLQKYVAGRDEHGVLLTQDPGLAGYECQTTAK